MHEWEIIQECVLLVKTLELMTENLSAEKHPMLSKVIPLMRGVEISL